MTLTFASGKGALSARAISMALRLGSGNEWEANDIDFL